MRWCARAPHGWTTADVAFSVPRGRDLELWFSATSVYGCHAYDSNLGANYELTLD